MAKTNPTSATPEVIKIEVDQIHRIAMERKKDLKMEMEMLARERDLLKKELGLTEKMQKYLELQKCGTEEKLERSNKRCEELEESVGRSERRREELEAKVNKLRQKLSRSRRKCEELRRKEIEAKSTNEETNWDVDGGDKGIYLEKEPRNGETKIDQVLNVNHASDKSVADAEEDEETLNVPEMDEDGKRKANAGDGDAFSPEVCGNSDKSGGNRGIELSTEAAATAKETPNVPESDENSKQKVNLGDGDGDAFSPEVCGTSDKSGGNRGIELSTEGRPAADRFRPKEAYNSGTVIEKQVDRDGTPEARDVAFHLQRCCDLNIINQIKKHLCSENLERFEKSCFGHFLNLNQLEYQGHVLLHLVMHMDMAASSNKRLVFRIKNSVVEFGPRDLSRITGLRLGELGPMIEMSSPSSSILRDAFKNRSTIFVKHIKAAFLSVSRVHKGSGELALKLAMLYFLHGNLLSDNPLKKMDLKYFTLVEDLDRFDKFPWGQVAFEFLASSMCSARRWVDFSKASHRRLSNRQFMLGFSFALQVWAYETMPSLAEFCEARVVNPETSPTILRWSALKRRVRFEYLKVFFETDQGPSSVVQGIRASPMEAKRRPRESSIRRVKEEKGKVCDAAKPSPSTAAENRRKRKRSEETQQAFAPAS